MYNLFWLSISFSSCGCKSENLHGCFVFFLENIPKWVFLSNLDHFPLLFPSFDYILSVSNLFNVFEVDI